jgi:hypothetical protein
VREEEGDIYIGDMRKNSVTRLQGRIAVKYQSVACNRGKSYTRLRLVTPPLASPILSAPASPKSPPLIYCTPLATQPRNVVSLPDISEDAARPPQRLVRAGAGHVCRYRLKRGAGASHMLGIFPAYKRAIHMAAPRAWGIRQFIDTLKGGHRRALGGYLGGYSSQHLAIIPYF